MKWSSQKMVGPLFISSCIRYNSSLSGMEPRENPWGRCEKDADICGDTSHTGSP
nr:MAG TPA: hypothetical protein [Caudoviricetes sp.]